MAVSGFLGAHLEHRAVTYDNVAERVNGVGERTAQRPRECKRKALSFVVGRPPLLQTFDLILHPGNIRSKQ